MALDRIRKGGLRFLEAQRVRLGNWKAIVRGMVWVVLCLKDRKAAGGLEVLFGTS